MPEEGPLGIDAPRHDEVREPRPFLASTSQRAGTCRDAAEAVPGTDAKGQLAASKAAFIFSVTIRSVSRSRAGPPHRASLDFTFPRFWVLETGSIRIGAKPSVPDCGLCDFARVPT